FVTHGPLKNEYEQERKLFFEAAQPDDEHDVESVLDWFLFDWVNDAGVGVIDYYVVADETTLDEVDREVLSDWLDSINSVFEVRAIGKDSIQLRDLDTGDKLTVKTRSDSTPFEKGNFIIARLLPFGDDLIFSGLQFLMPDRESAMAWIEMNQAFEAF